MDSASGSNVLEASEDRLTSIVLTEEADFSASLSAAMEFAGFKAANARVQSGMALVLEDMLRLAMRTHDGVFVFGSFSDGWGSSLTQLDGRIDSDSDIDVTVLLPLMPVHMRWLTAVSCQCDQGHRTVRYDDGHVNVVNNVTGPNLPITGSLMLPAIDVITAVPCCRYPPIDLLRPGRQTHISSHILRALSQELQSPRCHAVAASPPGLERSRMRVSTTLLERTVMHQLTTVQGQFFILLKFLIKKVISHRVNGLKTYMAKNLLFYMLDETPAEDWQPQNLVPLVRQSLQILMAMMESSASDDVCMTHFFLRDASVYLKKDHNPKPDITEALLHVSKDLPQQLIQFKQRLSKIQVDAVQFHIFLPIIGVLEVLSSDAVDQYEAASDCLHEAMAKLYSDEDRKDAGHFRDLLAIIDKIPDCAMTFRNCLRALACLKVGQSFDEAAASSSISVITGVPCHHQESELSVTQARMTVLDLLHQSGMLQFELTPDGTGVSRFPLMQDLLAGVPEVLAICCSEAEAGVEAADFDLHNLAILCAVVSRSQLLTKVFVHNSSILQRYLGHAGIGGAHVSGIASGPGQDADAPEDEAAAD